MKRRLLVAIWAILSLSLSYGQDVDTTSYDTTGYHEDIDDYAESQIEEYDSAATEEYETDDEYESSAPALVEPETLESTSAYKAEKIQVKKFDRARWKEVVGSAKFIEDEPEEAVVSTPSVPWAGEVMRLIGYVLIIGVVGFLIYTVIRNTRIERTKRKKTSEVTDTEAPVEHIEEFDIQTLLQKALSEGNFRMAVRLYYLGLLKKLHELGMIDWKKDKTNRDYLSELFEKNYLFDEVRKLTVAYEHVWYGQYTPNNESYQRLFSNFENLSEKINQTKAS